mgnify:CR=1 FL=1|tara:strand:+ start:10420 stop:11337 length:918 start_codon:yes stop_codon:yes gene_type:complete
MAQSLFAKDGTAQGVAKQRYIESLAKSAQRVIDDPYSKNFVIGSGLMKLMGHGLNTWLSKKIAPGFHEHIISRTRLIDDLVEENSINGFEQYVILGAGYDSRAHRLKLPDSLKIFEVDQKEVQDKKLSKLPRELLHKKNITYVSVNFTNQLLHEQLLLSGFDKKKKTIFTLEGVSQYVTRNALISTIEAIAKLSEEAGSIFFISYVNELLNKDPGSCFGDGYVNAAKKAELIKKLSAKAGEPWISFYSTRDMEKLLSTNSFLIKENLTFEDLNSSYFGTVGRDLAQDQIFKLEHFVIAESQNNAV